MPHHIPFANEKPAVAIGAAVNFIAHALSLFPKSLATASAPGTRGSQPAISARERRTFQHLHGMTQSDLERLRSQDIKKMAAPLSTA